MPRVKELKTKVVVGRVGYVVKSLEFCDSGFALGITSAKSAAELMAHKCEQLGAYHHLQQLSVKQESCAEQRPLSWFQRELSFFNRVVFNLSGRKWTRATIDLPLAI